MPRTVSVGILALRGMYVLLPFAVLLVKCLVSSICLANPSYPSVYLESAM